MRIAATNTALPKHWYPQSVLTEYLVELQTDRRVAAHLKKLHQNTGVQGRYLALPLEAYASLEDFSAYNAAWIEAATELSGTAALRALEQAQISVRDVDAIFFSTVTGLASPSIDARLINRLGFRTDLKRLPMFGLGCVAGAALLSRASDYLRGHRNGVALVVTVELCSLTLQSEDRSVANLISTGLFGDGAAAAVLVGDARKQPGQNVLATQSIFYPDTEDVMGWDIGAHGFRIVLSKDVPTIARERIPSDVASFLKSQGVSQNEITRWIAHPGGPKVLEALAEGLHLSSDDLRCSWDALKRAGNLSSASVLMILEDTLKARPMQSGEKALVLAMGPGFCSELLLLEQT